MIEIKPDGSIRISHGDTLNISFQLQGYEVQEGDVFVFTVKKTPSDDEILIRLECVVEEDKLLTVIVGKDDMKTLEIGKKYYDVCVLQGIIKNTLMFPKKLVIAEVVNDE